MAVQTKLVGEKNRLHDWQISEYNGSKVNTGRREGTMKKSQLFPTNSNLHEGKSCEDTSLTFTSAHRLYLAS